MEADTEVTDVTSLEDTEVTNPIMVAGMADGSGTSLPSNPIGSLQEYCVKCSLPLPIYDLQNTSGQPHQRNFEIIAKVGAIASNGTGTSKKDAKRDAATALLDKLKALGSEVASAAGANTNGTEVDEELAKQVSNMKVDILVSILFLFILKNITAIRFLLMSLIFYSAIYFFFCCT